MPPRFVTRLDALLNCSLWSTEYVDEGEQFGDQPTRRTLFALRHFVQTLARRGAPSTMIRSRWMLGFQRRRERRCE
jgi:hypothetical protein